MEADQVSWGNGQIAISSDEPSDIKQFESGGQDRRYDKIDEGMHGFEKWLVNSAPEATVQDISLMLNALPGDRVDESTKGSPQGSKVSSETSKNAPEENTNKTENTPPTMNGPALMATPEEINAARAKIEAGNDIVANEAWEKTKARADNTLGRNDLLYNPDITTSKTFHNDAMEAAAHARDLAFAYQMTGNVEYAEKAAELLKSWATEKNPLSDNTSARGLYLGRIVTEFSYAYSLIHDYLPSSDQNTLNTTYAGWADQIKSSQQYWINNDYLGEQDYNNHLSAQNMGLLAIGIMIEDPALVTYAVDSQDNPRDAKEMIQGAIYMEGDTLDKRDPGTPPPQNGEIYDRYRDIEDGKGMHYSFLHLQFLMRIATMAENSGAADLFGYTAPTGENLQLALDFYAEFMRTRDSSVNGGFYAGDHVDPRFLTMYETGRAEYPDSTKIESALTNGGNRSLEYDAEVYGYTEVLLRGQ